MVGQERAGRDQSLERMVRPVGQARAGAYGEPGKSASVRLDGVCKTLGGTQVLAGISLDVQPGEFVTLLGPSGSGKTSTLMVIAGFMVPERGRVFVGDRDMTEVPPGRRRNMGVVFQNYALFPHMSVAGNVAFPLRVRGLPRREVADRVEKALALVRLEGLADRRPARLSGGQQQRVALARALIFEPSVLLMDEPLGALDVRLKQELQWEIRSLQRAIGATVIYVTHDQNEALLLSDRIALLRDGRIEQVGSPQQLYRAPASVFAARFLGESNLLSGRYEAGPDSGLRVGGTGLLLPLLPRVAPPAVDGEACVGLLRPEALSIAAAGAGDAADRAEATQAAAQVAGVVQEAVFVGQAMRYVVTADQLPVPLIVHQPIRAGMQILAPGGRARVQWNAADLHLIPERRQHDAPPL